MAAPLTKAGRWLVDRSQWNDGMRGFFVRINATAGPEDMLIHVLAIEREAAAAALRGEEAWLIEAERVRQDERERLAALVREERDAYLVRNPRSRARDVGIAAFGVVLALLEKP